MPLGAHKAAIMGVSGVSTGDVVLLYDEDHSNASAVSITSGLTSTYGEYIFGFYNINPATDTVDFDMMGSADGGSNYNVNHTTTFFSAYHYESDSSAALAYQTDQDASNESSAYQSIFAAIGNGADEHASGKLHLFNPASTTYAKHFYSEGVSYHSNDNCANEFMAGYFNTTSAVNAIQFKMSSGNFDGTIKLWGVK